MCTPVIAIFDIGKTNKKLFLFDEDYKIVWEKSDHFDESIDEDGDPCENLERLTAFIRNSLHALATQNDFSIKAINVAAYGASFVYINGQGEVIAPLYNYLKTYPEVLKKKFYDTYGGEVDFSFRTASPVLGSLNSGMQLYRIKYEKPDLFRKIRYALHLPQFVSFVITSKPYSEITSIGCHTNLWDFEKNGYHEWVTKENMVEKFPPVVPSDKIQTISMSGQACKVGVGLHDSSAALIPYLVGFEDPFVLISTGTWCISLNPFNHQSLTQQELANDCLCYLQFRGKPVKASRLFAGYTHDQQIARIASHFNQQPEFYKAIDFNPEIIHTVHHDEEKNMVKDFGRRRLEEFSTAEEAYHRLMMDILSQQHASTGLVLKGTKVKRIFVDGGFSKNPLYMNMLAGSFPEQEVYAASVAQATAMGAALAIHDAWNTKPISSDLIELKYYATAQMPHL